MRLPFLFLAALFFCSSACADPRNPDAVDPRENAQAFVLKAVSEKKLSQSIGWRKLLHFEPDGGKLKSQVDSSNFFLSPEGKTNAEAELIATIQSFFAITPTSIDRDTRVDERDLSQCRFPARYNFLKRSLSELKITWPDQPCPRLTKYVNALQGESVSLVFSSYHLNNPSSAFGHTFLRINKFAAKDGRRYELLDYGLNYAATVDTGNALVYAFRGLFGFFSGNFTSVPYYYKVREYNDSESRDLWEYELNVSMDEVRYLILHIWELGPTNINYFYLSENCSYHMLTLLEAAKPELELSAKAKDYVIPQDTVQIVWDSPGLVKSFKYRPSLRTHLAQRLSMLNPEEIRELQILMSQATESSYPEKPFAGLNSSTLSKASQQKILDAALDYVDFKYFVEIQKDTKEKKIKDQLLRQRSQIDLISEELNIPTPIEDEPHRAHASRRMSLGLRGTSDHDTQLMLQYKFALHDFLDASTGYPDYATITFADIQARASKKTNSLDLERLTFFEVISLSPWKEFFKTASWRLKVSIERLTEPAFINIQGFQVSGGPGITYLWTEKNSLITYFGLKGQVLQPLWGEDRKTHFGFGPNFIFRYRFNPHLNFLFESWGFQNFRRSNAWNNQNSLSAHWAYEKNRGLRLTGIDSPEDESVSLEWMYYY